MENGFGNYDPYDHRLVVKPLSDLEAFLYLMKCTFGTGCLAIPHAFHNAGWVMGIFCMLLISVMTVYTMHLLFHGMYKLCKRHEIPRVTYPEAMRLSLLDGPPFLRPLSDALGFLIEFLLCFHHFGVCCVYVIFIGNNIKSLSDVIYEPVDSRIFMSMLIVPLILAYVVRSLKYLVPFMVIAEVLMIIAYSIIIYYVTDNLPDIRAREYFHGFYSLPLFFGTVLFAIESVGALVAIEQEMENPQCFLGKFGVLNRGMFILISFYTLFGFLGYWKFGGKTAPSISDNLPMDNIFTCVMKAFLSMGMYLSYAIQGYVTVGVVWHGRLKMMLPPHSDLIAWELMVRIIIVLSSVLIAMIFPYFANVLAFVGSFCLSFLGLVFPSLLDLCIYYKAGLTPQKILCNTCLIFAGLACGISGSILAIYNISLELK